MPELSEQQMLTKIDRGELSLLSVDTSILRRYSYNLEHGILQHLSQFSSSKIDLVFSDIVIKEMTSHMLSSAAVADRDIDKAIKSIANVRGISRRKLQSDIGKIVEVQTPREIIKKRIDSFISATNATYVNTSELLTTERLISDYFNERPPFEKKDSKKNEFPDAMALQSLDQYAKNRRTLMLVVSSDNGWKEFCRLSRRLVCIEDLVMAMGYFHRVPSVAATALADQVDKISPDIETKISEYYDLMGVDFWVTSDHRYDIEVTEVEYRHFEYSGESPFNLINYFEKHQSYVFESTIDAEVLVEADITFYAEVNEKTKKIGEITKSEVFTHDISILITITGDLNGDFVVDDVEITRIDTECNFGEVNPD